MSNKSRFDIRHSSFDIRPEVAISTTLRRSRRGLAPLELVLSLPPLLMVMALMVAYGNAAYWKVRGLTVARNAVWSQRFPRTGQSDPPPRSWPAPARMSVTGAVDVAALDNAGIQHPVARGPQVGAIEVDGDLLDPSRGLLSGRAGVARDGAMLPTVTAFRYELEHPVLEDTFQYPQMEIPANMFRRIPKLYTLPKPDGSYSSRFAGQVRHLVSSPLQTPLTVLDQDDELRAFYGTYLDFHPRLQIACSMDVNDVAANEVRDLYLRIKGNRNPRVQGVPERITRAFLRMYQIQLQQLLNPTSGAALPSREILLAEAGDGPSLALYEALAMKADDGATIGQLEAKIKLLQEFLAKIREQLDNEDRGLGDRNKFDDDKGGKSGDKPKAGGGGKGAAGEKPLQPKAQGKDAPRPRMPNRSPDDDGDGRRPPKKEGAPEGAKSILAPAAPK